MRAELARKLLVVYQSQELPFLLGQSEIFRLYYLLLRHLDRRKAN